MPRQQHGGQNMYARVATTTTQTNIFNTQSARRRDVSTDVLRFKRGMTTRDDNKHPGV